MLSLNKETLNDSTDYLGAICLLQCHSALSNQPDWWVNWVCVCVCETVRERLLLQYLIMICALCDNNPEQQTIHRNAGAPIRLHTHCSPRVHAVREISADWLNLLISKFLLWFLFYFWQLLNVSGWGRRCHEKTVTPKDGLSSSVSQSKMKGLKVRETITNKESFKLN